MSAQPYTHEELAHLEEFEQARERYLRLAKMIGLGRLPEALLEHIRLVPEFYNPDTNRFEFKRTPNIFPTGRLTFAGAGVLPLSQATAFGGLAANLAGPWDITPTDSKEWRLLGGVLTCNGANKVVLRTDGGRRAFAAALYTAAGVQAFTVPGNGARLDVKIDTSLEIAVGAAAAVDFTLYVAEEQDQH